jgi:hypothetical protein
VGAYKHITSRWPSLCQLSASFPGFAEEMRRRCAASENRVNIHSQLTESFSGSASSHQESATWVIQRG